MTQGLPLRSAGALLFVISCFCVSTDLRAQDSRQGEGTAPETPVENPREQKVKAAYIYNFCKYFGWPEHSFATPDSPFVVGVLGNDSLGNQLDLLAKRKKIKNRKITIKRFTSMDQYEACHILFVPTSVTLSELKEAVKGTGQSSLLIVSDGHEPPGHGAVVTLYWKEDQTIGFEIDLNAVKRRSLDVNAKLLKIARVARH